MRALFICILLSHGAYAKVIYYGSETETLTLAYGGPTLVRFPEEVKTISQVARFVISPADEEKPSYALLSITPRFSKGEDKVTFILSDGTLVHTQLVVVSGNSPEKTDSFYDLKSKDSLLPQIPQNGDGDKVSELELMKAMIRGDEVTGYEIRQFRRAVSLGVPGIKCDLLSIYTGSRFNGYIYELLNKTEDDLSVDVTTLTLGKPNQALLSQVDNNTLKKGKRTLLRIVAKPSSQYQNMRLPITTLKEGK